MLKGAGESGGSDAKQFTRKPVNMATNPKRGKNNCFREKTVMMLSKSILEEVF